MFLKPESLYVKILFTVTNIPFRYREHAYFFCTLFIANCSAIEQKSTKYKLFFTDANRGLSFYLKNYQQENQCFLYS